MAKKKRKHRSKQLPETIPVPVQENSSKAIASGSFFRKRPILITSAVLLAGAIGLFALRVFRTPRQAPPAIVKSQETPEAILQRLSHHNFEGMEKQVVEKIRQLLQQVNQNPTSAFAWGKLAMNLDVHDLKKESIICYQKAAALNPEDFRWPYYMAIALSGMGSPDALTHFERSTTLKPGYAPAWIRHGQALYDAKQPDEAAQKFQRAVQIEPTSHAHVGLARVYVSQNKLEESRTHLLEAVRLQPKHGEAHGLLSEVYRRLNRPLEAQNELWISQQLPKRTPLPDEQISDWVKEGVSSYWYDTRGRLYMDQGEYEAAIRELTMAAKTTTDPRIFDTLGIAYQYVRRYDEAAKYHQKALELQPESGSMLNNMASVFFEKGNLPKALEYMEKAIQAEPNFAYSYHHLGQIHLRTNNRKSAIAAYRLGQKRLPQNAQIATQLAWLLATSPESSLRNGKEAVRLAEDVFSKSPTRDPQTLIALAAAYAENGEFDRAVQTATQARQMIGNEAGLSRQVDSHIALYQQKKPYHE